MILGDYSPDSAVATARAIVAHEEIMLRRDANRTEVNIIIIFELRLVELALINVDCPVAKLQSFARKAYYTLYVSFTQESGGLEIDGVTRRIPIKKVLTAQNRCFRREKDNHIKAMNGFVMKSNHIFLVRKGQVCFVQGVWQEKHDALFHFCVIQRILYSERKPVYNNSISNIDIGNH